MEAKTSTQMATMYGLKSSIAFNKLMVRCGILKAVSGGKYVLEDNMRGWGYSTVIEVPYFLPNGIRATKKKSAWTVTGQHFIHKRLERLGILPSGKQTDLFGTFTN